MGVVHVLALAVVLGVVAAVWWPIVPGTALSGAVACAALAAIAPAGRWRVVLLLVAVGTFGAAHTARARDAVLAPPLGAWFAAYGDSDEVASQPIRVRGELTADASIDPGGAVRLGVRVREVDAGDGWLPAPGDARLFVQGEIAHREFQAWRRGRLFDAVAVLRWPPALRNPGGPDQVRLRLRRAHALTGTVKSALLVHVAPGSLPNEAAAMVRWYIRRHVERVMGEERRVGAAVVTAILIGDRAGLSRELTERLIAAGTYHVVAISGGNVAFVVLMAVLSARCLFRSTRLVSLAALLGVGLYGWIVGDDPSVARAVAAAVVWLGADALGVRAPPLRIFSLVVLIVVCRDPLIVVKPGAWLSFGATLGILVWAGAIADGVAGTMPPSASWMRRLTRLAVTLGAATLAAEVVLLPVGAWTFSRVSVAGVLLNFAAIPAMAVVQLAGGLLALTAVLLPGVASCAAMVADGATTVLVGSAGLVEQMPWLAWRVPPPPFVLLGAYYASLGVCVSGCGGRRMRMGASMTAAVLALGIVTGPTALLAQPPRGTLRLSVLDVGQGDAIVVQFPSGQVLVVDAGAASETFDTGERVVAPALWALGVRRVDWVAFTHADLDHVGGAAAIAEEFGAREIWEGVPVLRSRERLALRALAAERRIVWRQLRRGDRWDAGGAEVEVLHPPAPDWERPAVRNDDSLVLRIRFGPVDVLLTGDIGVDVERQLPLLNDDPRLVRVLKVGHHGSRTSTGTTLVEAFRPWVAVVSAGRNNTFGHPAPEVVERLEGSGATVLRTDRDGAVLLETDGRTVHLRTWTGRRWRVRVLPGP